MQTAEKKMENFEPAEGEEHYRGGRRCGGWVEKRPRKRKTKYNAVCRVPETSSRISKLFDSNEEAEIYLTTISHIWKNRWRPGTHVRDAYGNPCGKPVIEFEVDCKGKTYYAIAPPEIFHPELEGRPVSAVQSGRNLYVQRSDPTSKGNPRVHYFLHPDEECIDHIDRNGLNCCRCNVRPVTKAQNSSNCRKRRDNTSGATGVYRHGTGWNVLLKHQRKVVARKWFSDNKYGGFEGAFETAKLWREERAAEIGNTNGQE